MSEHKGKCCGACTWDGVPDKCCCKTINITNVYNSPSKKKIQEKQRENLIELGVLRERQRIIALLENNLKAWMAEDNPTAYDLGCADGASSALGLIKEKNK
jgi:hypothetical protein